MRRISIPCFTFLLASVFMSGCSQDHPLPQGITLTENWSINSSDSISSDGAVLSTVGFNTGEWYPTTMPSTVLAALVRNKLYPDPYYGTNVRSLPGYVEGRRREIPPDSPFQVSWWYRTEFTLPADFDNRHVWLHLPGVNYKANVWFNGSLVADTTQIEGAYRRFDLDLMPHALAGGTNCLALQIFPPHGMDLTITWVDWNPTPPDHGMGIWYDVKIDATGPVAIDNTHIVTDLDLPSVDHANVSVTANLKNLGDKSISGTLKGVIENLSFEQAVSLDANSSKEVTFSPDAFPQLRIENPRLWWPHNVGEPNLYDLTLTFETRGGVSATKTERFGIREITDRINHFNDSLNTRVFQVNGKDIVVRGGGYVEDMMLRPSMERMKTDVQYARQMNLNALRMEAPRGPDEMFEYCDEQGIMLMVGWCCCSSWERWRNWTPHIADIAEASLHDQVIRLRNHASVFDWLYGSDNFPPAEVEQRYIKVLDEDDGTRPYQSSATQDSSAIAGHTGLWMGPYPDVYAYFPPTYWYGKLEFNTECGPGGEQIPPIESLKKMMPEKDLWPRSDSWEIRLHNRFDPQAQKALFSRYGEPKGLEEYAMKSQMLQLEATRAMFEAYAGNKYKSSGIIYWMYNSAWPSMYWQLFDYYHNPNGSFYGARSACEPLHIQYAYNDRNIYVVNGLYQDYNNLKASAKVYDFNMQEKLSAEATINIGPDESKQVLSPKWPQNLSGLYFLKLELRDASGNLVSSNFYWLSSKGDENADFRDIMKLPETELNVTADAASHRADSTYVDITFKNPSTHLAFFVNPKIKTSSSQEMILPISWDDNYFSLLPGEERTIGAHWKSGDAGSAGISIEVDGWNVKKAMLPIN